MPRYTQKDLRKVLQSAVDDESGAVSRMLDFVQSDRFGAVSEQDIALEGKVCYFNGRPSLVLQALGAGRFVVQRLD